LYINYLVVGAGAAIGGMARYWLSHFVQKYFATAFPYGTMTINIVGSFALGFFMYYLSARKMISSEMQLFLTVGFCGGFTTFSTFSLETVNLLRDSEFLLGGINIVGSVVLCLLGTYLAYVISK
jgi:fluoride exporter